uniref:Relaxin family peptide receptor 3.3a1 n=2 Tax=Scleropages formosus TaxID=113540 RepID=A0A8C9SJV8_SCLFO
RILICQRFLKQPENSASSLMGDDDVLNQSGARTPNRSLSHNDRFLKLEDIEVSADGSPVLRIIISIVYSVVCVVGLVGNLLVLFLMKVKQGVKRSSINLFVLNLAVTDFQFVLTLPFWAADTALDFSWPFGDAMCRIVLSVTVMNMYASVFFLTAMSVTRYRSVASALEERASGTRCSAPWVSALLWLSASAATAPTFTFSSVVSVAGEKLCLLRFPEGQRWLALYHVQKIVVAFVVPMVIVSVCYLRLLRFIRRRSSMMRKKEPRRGSSSSSRVTRSRVTRSVTVVVLSFFLCWMPNHAITLWGVLVKFNVVRWDKSYYMIHTYVFPVSVCLAHVNSCLNPVLYCLMRREFRAKIVGFLFLFSCRDQNKETDVKNTVLYRPLHSAQLRSQTVTPK